MTHTSSEFADCAFVPKHLGKALPKPLVGFRGNATDPLSFVSAYDPRQFQLALKLRF